MTPEVLTLQGTLRPTLYRSLAACFSGEWPGGVFGKHLRAKLKLTA